MDGIADAALGMGGISLMQQQQQQQLLYQQQLQQQQRMLSHLHQGGGEGGEEGTNDADFTQQLQTPVPAAAAAAAGGGNVLLPVHRTSLHQRLVQAVVPKSPSKFMSWQKKGASALPISSPSKAAAADGAAVAAAPGSNGKQAGVTRPLAGASSSRNLWR